MSTDKSKLSLLIISIFILSILLTGCWPNGNGNGIRISEEYSLFIEVEGKGEVEPEPEEEHIYDENTMVSIEVAPASGWELEKWAGEHGEDVRANDDYEIFMNEDKEIKAVFAGEQLQIEENFTFEDVLLGLKITGKLRVVDHNEAEKMRLPQHVVYEQEAGKEELSLTTAQEQVREDGNDIIIEFDEAHPLWDLRQEEKRGDNFAVEIVDNDGEIIDTLQIEL